MSSYESYDYYEDEDESSEKSVDNTFGSTELLNFMFKMGQELPDKTDFELDEAVDKPVFDILIFMSDLEITLNSKHPKFYKCVDDKLYPVSKCELLIGSNCNYNLNIFAYDNNLIKIQVK